MRFSKTFKGAFLIINHVTATHFPPIIALNPKLHGPRSNSANDVAAGDLASMPLVPRIDEYCSYCRDRCPKDKIIDPEDCGECLRCPKGKTPNKPQEKCIRNKSERDKKTSKYKEKKRKEIDYYRDKGRRYKEKKAEKQKSYNRARNKEDRKQVRRMGRCLPIVPLVMGPTLAEKYGDEFFDEDFLESMTLLDLWPQWLEVEEWESEEDDAIYESENYLDAWVEFGKENEKRSFKSESRSLAARSLKVRSIHQQNQTDVTNTGITAPSEKHQLVARCPWCWLIPIFAAAASAGARAGSAAARAGMKLSKNGMKIAKGRGSNRTKKEQKDGAKNISDNKQWLNCLKGFKPTK